MEKKLENTICLPNLKTTEVGDEMKLLKVEFYSKNVLVFTENCTNVFNPSEISKIFIGQSHILTKVGFNVELKNVTTVELDSLTMLESLFFLKSLENLNTLIITNCSNTTKETLKLLSDVELPNLENLLIMNSNIEVVNLTDKFRSLKSVTIKNATTNCLIIQDCSSLEELCVDECPLDKLGLTGSLDSLRKVSINKTLIKSFVIGRDLLNLQELLLTHNKIQRVSLLNTPNLVNVDLSFNYLTNLNEMFFRRENSYSNLKSLSLTNNRLENLVSDNFFPSLTSLNVDNNVNLLVVFMELSSTVFDKLVVPNHLRVSRKFAEMLRKCQEDNPDKFVIYSGSNKTDLNKLFTFY